MSYGKEHGRETINRRDFLKAGAAGVFLGAACSGPEKAPAGVIVPSGRLGRTGMNASILGMGGGSALSMIKDDQEAVALLELARQKGVNYFDSGDSYGGGKSEKRMGEALEPHRSSVYFATKYDVDNDYDKLMKKFEQSLEHFRTDYIDVVQMHGLSSLDDVEKMFESGALETLVKLREQGSARYLGVTSHLHPPALAEAMRRFDFDVVLMGANASKVPFTFEFEVKGDGSFEDVSLPVALEKKVGIYAFKITGQRRLIATGNEAGKASGSELIRYGLSLPAHGIILGMHTREHVESAASLAASFTPMTDREMRELNNRLAPSANAAVLDYLRPDYVDNGGYRAHLA
ncbi:MAG: aldo/keto reductase [Candidatus Glassbacteria bacterium]|nr:aldo/keto reductase [Candidatus Glassbacteria bacterium]